MYKALLLHTKFLENETNILGKKTNHNNRPKNPKTPRSLGIRAWIADVYMV